MHNPDQIIPIYKRLPGLRKCCNPIGPCSGHMQAFAHDPDCPIWYHRTCTCWAKEEVWVAAHNMPVFAQCDECGYAPSGRTGRVARS